MKLRDFSILTPLLLSLGCGYSFQGTRNPLLEEAGIRTIYISPLMNNTYKAGAEVVVYNALVRTIASHRRIKLVQDPALADAILAGEVGTASYGGAASTAVSSLAPQITTATGTAGIGASHQLAGSAVANIYQANLSCSFHLDRTGAPPPGKSTTLWASGFSQSKIFTGANQLDVLGTTSALINESEFERALSDMAQASMADLHESMLAMF
jgi:hypothetical protein